MNAALGAAYDLTWALASRAADAAALLPGEAKLLRACRGRHGLLARYAAWAATHRDPERPLLWMHAPSVGEGLQARPILQALRRTQPALQLAFTHYSPSAEVLASTCVERGIVDFADYLPWDTSADAGAALDVLRPQALVFSKVDVWPRLVAEAGARRVRLGLVSATLSAASARRSPWGLAVLQDAYSRLDAVGAIDSEDAERLRAVGVRDSAMTVTGDSRYDQVWDRASRAARPEALLAPLTVGRQPTIVAGSTWPTDERVVLEGWLATRQHVVGARLILAPHEPTPSHVLAVERWAVLHGVTAVRLDAAVERGGPSDLVLVDRVGVLGDLYALADVAYVGGGFQSSGLHSVLEPAAFGVPVLFGPGYEGSRDACRLMAAGAALSVRDAGSCAAAMTSWLIDATARRAAGDKARDVVKSGLGAAERNADIVRQLVNSY
jgi:3-deoxy-D-manno-octulosonic-acid transferase